MYSSTSFAFIFDFAASVVDIIEAARLSKKANYMF